MAETKSTTPERIFYIYRHIRLDTNQVFYIGKGVGCRRGNTFSAFYSRALTPKHRSPFWYRITANTEYDVEIVMEFTDESACFAKEKELIALYGRRNLGTGSLCNLTDGGEGPSGCFPDERTKNKMREARARQSPPVPRGTKKYPPGSRRARPPRTEESRRMMREKMRGRVFSPEHCKKISISKRGKKMSPETRQRMSQSKLGHPVSEATRRKMSTTHTRRHANGPRQQVSQETRRKISIALKGKPKPRKPAVTQPAPAQPPLFED
jgi:hypothetical protein